MAFAEDLTLFFSTTDFGETVTFTHAGVTANANVLFDDAFVDPLGIEGSYPRASGRAVDFPDVAHHDAIVRSGGVAYKVIGVQKDGTGIVVLKLQKQ